MALGLPSSNHLAACHLSAPLRRKRCIGMSPRSTPAPSQANACALHRSSKQINRRRCEEIELDGTEGARWGGHRESHPGIPPGNPVPSESQRLSSLDPAVHPRSERDKDRRSSGQRMQGSKCPFSPPNSFILLFYTSMGSTGTTMATRALLAGVLLAGAASAGRADENTYCAMDQWVSSFCGVWSGGADLL